MIEIKNLSKFYGSHQAVCDLNLTIENGQIYGFLGPNGAGKSTTMNIMTGCLAASEGQVLINGHDIFDEAEEAKKLIGYLPEIPPLYQDMTPLEYLQFVAKAKKVPKAARQSQIDHAMSVTQITDIRNRLIKNLSKGYRQRVGIAQAILGDPQIIILDEPTVGLDPIQIIEIRDLIKELGKKHTVILSSHILSEVRAVCDRIMIISKGRLVASDTPDNLEKLFAGKTQLKLEVRADEEEAKNILKEIAGISDLSFFKATVENALGVAIETNGKNDISEDVFFAFSRAERPILRMSLNSATLEDVFLELTGGKNTEKEAV